MLDKSPYKFLSIDPMSTFAIYDGEKLETYSVDKKKPFFSFYSIILDILKIGKSENEYKAVAMEYSHFKYLNSSKIMNFQRGILKMFCEFLNIPLYEYAPISVKKSFTGNAKAKKEDMIAECEKKGFNVKNDHEADAIAIYYHHINQIK